MTHSPRRGRPSAIASRAPRRPLTERLQDGGCYAAIGLVVAGVAWAAAMYGGVEAWSVAPLVIAGAALTAITLFRLGAGRAAPGLWLPCALLAAFALLASLQATPLSKQMVALLSPTRAADAERLLDETPGRLPLSYDPAATRHGLRMLLIGAAVFCASATCCSNSRRAKTLLAGLFVVGVAEACLSLAQIATGARGIYWSDLHLGRISSGSFINYSNFSQLMNLTAGAGLGLLLVRLSEDRRRRDSRRRWPRLREFVRRQGWIVGGLALQALAIAASLSRNGLFAMIVGSTVTGLLLSRKERLGEKAWLLALAPALAVGGALVIGVDAIFIRINTLGEIGGLLDRWELSKATLRLGADHLLTGVGLGSFEQAFPRYDTTATVDIAQQADNDYAQLFAETGVAGVVITAGFLAALAATIAVGLRQRERPLRYALYGVVYGLIAVAVQSATDFGQRVPAVFCVSAALSGLCWGLKQQTSPQRGAPRWPRLLAAAGGLVIAVPAWGWAVIESARDVRAERWWAVSYGIEQRLLGQRPGEADPQDYVDLVATAELAHELRPQNAEYAYGVNARRWRMVVGLSGADQQQIAADPEGRAVALRIADELARARSVFPVHGPLYRLEGRLRLLAGDPSGGRLTRLAVELAPKDPAALLALASVEAAAVPTMQEADARAALDEIAALLRRAIELEERSFPEAAVICLRAIGDPGLAKELAGRHPSRIKTLLKLVQQGGGEPALADELQAEIDRVNEQRVAAGEASADEIAGLARKRAAEGDDREATRLFRNALGLRYDQVKWRLELCRALVRQELYGQAEREARLVLRSRPGNEAARQLLREISRRKPPDTIGVGPFE